MKSVLFILALAFVDQIVKVAITENLGEPINLYGFEVGFFRNEVGSFSIPISNEMSMSLILMVLFILVFLLFQIHQRNIKYGIMMIIAGGVSNAIDRIFRGYVVDVIGFGSTEMNVADFIILTGALFVFIEILTTKLPKHSFYSEKATNAGESNENN